MILVDTSVWVDHFRTPNDALAGLLDAGKILSHPFVIGEISLGNLRQRDLLLSSLADLPQAVVATDLEVQHVIAGHALFGRGIGYVDAHLLTSVLLTPGARLWTLDKRLGGVGGEMGLSLKWN